jgi:2,4-dienoyl-CoA reductase-like NADH-dependent reductase (Old Yellow Enzyme family)
MNTGECDLISFGRLYISNPDLAERLINKHELNNDVNYYTWFGFENGPKGYTDYPTFKN